MPKRGSLIFIFSKQKQVADMITRKDAIDIASAYVQKKARESKYNLMLLLENTIEFELGWVFFYQSKEFADTRSFLEMLGGNAPIIVNKKNGSITETGTAYPTEKYIDDYRKSVQKL